MKQNKKTEIVKSKNRLYLKIFFSAAAVGAIIFFAKLDFIIVTGQKNGEFLVSGYKFVEDDFSHPRLKLLRTREHLNEVVASGKTQFEKTVLLRRWANRQWPAGSKFYYPPFDAVEILDLARKYKNYGFCAQYAVVFLQACQSMGLHARYVDILNHFVTAVWSDDYNKWVIMDPNNDVHYEKNGIPLKGRELCTAYWDGKVKGICKVSSDGAKKEVVRDDLQNYKLYSIVMRADQLSEPIQIKYQGQMRKLTLKNDFREYPTGSVGICGDFLAWREDEATEKFNDRTASDDPDDFRVVMNQTMIYLARRYPDKGELKVVLIPINTPNFKNFLIKADDKNWQESKDKIMLYLEHPGFHKLSARISTKFGWLGNESYIKVFYKPDLFNLLSNKIRGYFKSKKPA